MIKLHKSEDIPATLNSVSTPTNALEVHSEIYGAKDVREQLMLDQYDKCAYCECPITIQYNDVEHFRPKKFYYWLGYDWHNLLYSCDLCNRTYKKQKFPLIDESKRDLENKDITRETPLIINPYEVDPLEHIVFHEHILVPRKVDGIEDIIGKTTIDLFHLNDSNERRELVEMRRQEYESFVSVVSMCDIITKIIDQTIDLAILSDLKSVQTALYDSIAKYKSPAQPFAGMFVE